MTGSLVGKVAFVTSGSQGIGAIIVRRLAAEGASVAFTYASSHEGADALTRELGQHGYQTMAIAVDNVATTGLRCAINDTARRFGHIDVLVLDAGMVSHGTVDAARAAIAHMPRGSRVITIGSHTTDQAMVPGLTLDLAPLGITVSNVQAGPARAEMSRTEGARFDFAQANMPLKRMADPMEIADFVAWLARSEPSNLDGSSRMAVSFSS